MLRAPGDERETGPGAGIITQECRGQDGSRGPDSGWEISVTRSTLRLNQPGIITHK